MMVRIATITVAVGMAVMIIALAVISGFKKEITDKLVGFGAHVRITSLAGNSSLETAPITVDGALMANIAGIPDFKSISVYALKGGVIKTADAIQGIMLKGVGPDYDMEFFASSLVEGALPEVGGEERNKDLLISRRLAEILFLEPGDRVEIMFIGESRPVRRDRFKISGIYSSGMDQMDKAMTLTDIRNVQRLNGWETGQVSGYEVMTTDFGNISQFSEDVYIEVFRNAETTSDILKVENVVDLNPNTFDWLRAHNVNAVVIIVIMMLVALLNMISAMLIILLEKTSMIGVLKALGMTNGAIQKVFVLRSFRIVLTGMLWGNVAGLGISLAQKFTGLVTLDSSGYLISEVPIDIGWWWVLLNACVPLAMVFLLTVPAMVVSRIKPDRTIRYQ